METNHNLPVRPGLLKRPRIDALLSLAIEYPLVTVTAGPGYGKTQAVAGFLNNRDAPVLWYRLTSLDNLHASFWNNVVNATERTLPGLAQVMRKLQFPDTLAKRDAFVRMLAKNVSGGKRIIAVNDDFGIMEDPAIMAFYEAVVEAAPDNFCLILIAKSQANLDAVRQFADRQFSITGEDLRFTLAEISQLFDLYDKPLTPDQLTRVEAFTEGWALPLHLLLLQYTKDSSLVLSPDGISYDLISRMFEDKFFSGYSAGLQRALVEMSFLHGFTRELFREVCKKDAAEGVSALRDNVFISYAPSTQLYSFHNMYQNFLQEKSALLPDGAEAETCRMAAGHFAATGRAIEAISCYRRCGDWENMLGAIAEFGSSHEGFSAEQAEFFLEHIDLLSPAQLKQYPVADYLRAHIYLNMLELEKSEAILQDLARRMLDDGSPKALELAGDAYVLIGKLYMMTNREGFGAYFEKACGYLPNGTNFQNKDKPLVGNNHNFSMADNRPGALDRMEHAIHEAAPWISRALRGGLDGMEHIYSGEAAYLSYRFEDARQHVYKAVFKARASGQHDLVCNAYTLLMRIGLACGDYSEAREALQSLGDYAHAHDCGIVREIRDTALAWFYIKMDDYDKIPRWILSLDDNSSILLAPSRVQITYASYLSRTGEFTKMMGMMESPRGLYLVSGIWPDRISLYILLAIGYLYCGNPRQAMEALWAAYDMSYHNNLTTLFSEGGKFMRRLVAAARQQETYAFDPRWLDLVDARASTFAKKTAAVKVAYQKDTAGGDEPESMEQILSRREHEVLLSLSQGLTRDEIADFHSISINTVKSTITGIYNKLGAVNRADAIFIATKKGYLG